MMIITCWVCLCRKLNSIRKWQYHQIKTHEKDKLCEKFWIFCSKIVFYSSTQHVLLDVMIHNYKQFKHKYMLYSDYYSDKTNGFETQSLTTYAVGLTKYKEQNCVHCSVWKKVQLAEDLVYLMPNQFSCSTSHINCNETISLDEILEETLGTLFV